MKKLLLVLSLLLVTMSAFGQFTKVPDYQVETRTNGYFTYIKTTNTPADTLQSFLVWLDQQWPQIRAHSNEFSTINPTADTHQAIFNWLDAAWGNQWATNADIWLALGLNTTNRITNVVWQTGSEFSGSNHLGTLYLTRDDGADRVSVATSDWTRLNGDGGTNVQEVFNYLDGTILQDIYSNLNTEAQAGAVRGWFNGGYTSTVGTISFVGKDLSPAALTNIVHGGQTEQVNTNILSWGTRAGTDTNRVYFWRTGGYYLTTLVNIGWGDPHGATTDGVVVYGIIQNSNNVNQLEFPIASVAAPGGTGVTNYSLSSGSAVYYDAVEGDRFGVYAYSLGTTGSLNVGAIYTDAFKLYNRE